MAPRFLSRLPPCHRQLFRLVSDPVRLLALIALDDSPCPSVLLNYRKRGPILVPSKRKEGSVWKELEGRLDSCAVRVLC